MMILELLEDGFFAAIAAVGFAIISNPPRRSLFVSALLAAIGHSIRYFLMHFDSFSLSISQASFFASLSIGCLSVFFAKRLAVPAEVFAFPSLLPMIPGMFAGWLQEQLGYNHFFIWVMICSIIPIIAVSLLKINPNYGKATDKES